MNRAFGMLGLCARAGRLVSGEQAVTTEIRRGRAHLVLVDQAASDNTKKYLSDACSHYEVSLRFLPEGELGAAIGKSGRMTAAVTEPSFAGKLQKLMDTTENIDR